MFGQEFDSPHLHIFHRSLGEGGPSPSKALAQEGWNKLESP